MGPKVKASASHGKAAQKAQSTQGGEQSKIYQCSHCKQLYTDNDSNKKKWLSHQTSCTFRRPYPNAAAVCRGCPHLLFKAPNGLSRHINEVHKSAPGSMQSSQLPVQLRGKSIVPDGPDNLTYNEIMKELLKCHICGETVGKRDLSDQISIEEHYKDCSFGGVDSVTKNWWCGYKDCSYRTHDLSNLTKHRTTRHQGWKATRNGIDMTTLQKRHASLIRSILNPAASETSRQTSPGGMSQSIESSRAPGRTPQPASGSNSMVASPLAALGSHGGSSTKSARSSAAGGPAPRLSTSPNRSVRSVANPSLQTRSSSGWGSVKDLNFGQGEDIGDSGSMGMGAVPAGSRAASSQSSSLFRLAKAPSRSPLPSIGSGRKGGSLEDAAEPDIKRKLPSSASSRHSTAGTASYYKQLERMNDETVPKSAAEIMAWQNQVSSRGRPR